MANLRVDKITSTETFETTGSVQFSDPDTDYLSIPASSQFDIGTDYTAECWIYFNSLVTNNLFLGVETSFWLNYDTSALGTSNKFAFAIRANSTWQAVSSTTTPTTGNAQDFGDLSVGRFILGGCSDSDGGLGGF